MTKKQLIFLAASILVMLVFGILLANGNTLALPKDESKLTIANDKDTVMVTDSIMNNFVMPEFVDIPQKTQDGERPMSFDDLSPEQQKEYLRQNPDLAKQIAEYNRQKAAYEAEMAKQPSSLKENLQDRVALLKAEFAAKQKADSIAKANKQ